ncbi:MAG: IS30 family transposase [Acidimicrobiales bacterium]|jgi:IS30 family transposase
MAAHLTNEQRQLVFRLRRRGFSKRAIAKEIGLSWQGIHYVLRGQVTDPRPDMWTSAPGRLSIEEREEILIGLREGASMRSIARGLGRAPSTVTREVAANGGREHYRIWTAHQRARSCTRRPKSAKLDDPVLCAKVTTWLEEFWSPDEISRRLRREFPNDPTMHVSHETIYQSLYVQGRGELRRELARCLRSGRAQRRPQGRVERRGTIPEMVMISERPAEVEDRAVPGHWEGDLIIGANHASAVGTLVERSTRFVLLLHLGRDRTALAVEEAMKKAIATLPEELVRSVTWDQGTEMSNHRSFTVATGVPVYFCDPHSPWQRGSNENTNGLLRQYMPKGTDLSKHSADDLLRIQRSLNGRPRKTLDYMMPAEKLAELVALTT